ncbi:WcaI family glycosyltransferase [Autumnicola musiva]|uniref:WcaI family glycosyltransferase n=1 Tax=Autumnicola musiva TaxID=3075589 RepID=A0ABU3D2U7_9FLAO|nr:WcaI family glycosyltransferase [Zunongwangia sp. F117]MDT0675847.1 WcaI family glycosyltransferase [Zunongwangia sp. F117]
MNKRILLIGYNFSPEPTGIGKYSGEMVNWLANRGYECSVITTYPYYPFWAIQEPYRKHRFWFKKEIQKSESGEEIKIYRCPMYVPADPTGGKRMLSEGTFFSSALLQLLKITFNKKYDVVITVVPSFHLGFLGRLYKKLRNATFVYHVQDLQIEAARDLQMIKSNRLINFLLKVEKYFLDGADVVSSISEGMVTKIKQKAGKEVFMLPNWADTDFFHPVPDKEGLKQQFGFGGNDKIILYSGGIGEKQGLEAIIHVAEYFRQDRNVKFVICGSGPYKRKLQNLTEELNLINVIFFPLQPMEKFNLFLNMADVHLVIQKATASDLVMPSKLTTILSVGGLALITVNKGSGLYDVVKQHDMGLLIKAEDLTALKEGVINALDSSKHASIRKNARAYAQEYLAIDNVMTSFENHVLLQEDKKVLHNAYDA